MKIYNVIWYDEQDLKSMRWFSNKAEAEKFRKAQNDAYMYAFDIPLTKQGLLHFSNIHVQGDH